MVEGDFLKISTETVTGENELLGGIVEGLQRLGDLDVVLLVTVLPLCYRSTGSALTLRNGGVLTLTTALLGLHLDLTEILQLQFIKSKTKVGIDEGGTGGVL